MTPQYFTISFTLINLIIFLSYYLRKHMLQGIFRLAHIHFYNALLTLGFSIFNSFTTLFSSEQLFIGYMVILLISIAASFMAPMKYQLQKHLERQWYHSCLWILFSFLLANALALMHTSVLYPNLNSAEFLFNSSPADFVVFTISYFSMILLRYYADLKKQQTISNYISPIIQSLNYELEDFSGQLQAYQRASAAQESAAIAQLTSVLTEKVQLAKLPVYSNDLTLSMAVLPYMTEQSKINTWISAEVLHMPSAELALLIDILCRYVQNLDPQGLIGIQRTAYTGNQLIFSIHATPVTVKAIDAFVKKRRFLTPNGKMADHSYYAICFNWLLSNRGLKLRYQIEPDNTLRLNIANL